MSSIVPDTSDSEKVAPAGPIIPRGINEGADISGLASTPVASAPAPRPIAYDKPQLRAEDEGREVAGYLRVHVTKPAPKGFTAALWRKAQLVEAGRVVRLFQAAHHTDQDRVLLLLTDSRERAEDMGSENSERENARLIAWEAADDLAFEAAVAADPSIEPEWTFGGIIDNIARVHHLTPKEAAAVEVAAKALLDLPRIPYRQTRSEDAVESAQDDRGATEGANADTRAVQSGTSDEKPFIDQYRSLPPLGREIMEATLATVARGNLTPEKAAAALRAIDQEQQEGGAS